MKIEYKFKDDSVIYKIENARSAYAYEYGIRVFFKDKNGFTHDLKLNKKFIEYFFIEREKKDSFITPRGGEKNIKDIIEAARRCRYNVKKCANCPFYSANNPDCYIDFMDAIIYLLSGGKENG